MHAAAILEEIQRRGATVRPLEGGRLGVDPGSVLDDVLRAEIRSHKLEILAELTIDADRSLFEQLQVDWRSAIERAQSAFSENDILPDQDLLEATARLELKAMEWRRMDAAHFPHASQMLEELGAVYGGRATATVDDNGKVTIRPKESTS